MAIGKPPCDEAAILAGDADCAKAIGGRWVLGATILGSSLAFIDGTVVNVALPALQSSLHATFAGVQWVVEAYALTFAALLLTGGALGDPLRPPSHLCRRRPSSSPCVRLVCVFVEALPQLIAARALQGVGGALLVPGQPRPHQRLVSASRAWSRHRHVVRLHRHHRGARARAWRMARSHAFLLALVFFINLPLALVVLVITLRRVPENASGADPRNASTGPASCWRRPVLAGSSSA